MSHIHIGQLTASKEWAKHLRPWGKRAFWKRERKVARVLVSACSRKFPLQPSGNAPTRAVP